MKLFFYSLFIFILSIGCSQSPENLIKISADLKEVRKIVDTLNPNKTYEKLKYGYSEAIIDSVYQPLLESLNYQFKHELAIQHAKHYQSINSKNYKSQIFSLFAQSNANYFLGNYNKSIECAYRQIELCNSYNYTIESAQIYDNLADFELTIGHYDKSLKARLKALKFAEIHKNRAHYFSIKYGLASNYKEEENWRKAIECVKEVLNFHLSKNPTDQKTASDFTYLSGLYTHLKEYEIALFYGKKAIQIYSKINNIYGKSECYNNLGLTYRELKKYNLAYDAFSKAIELSVKPSTKSTIFYNRGLTLFKQNKLEEAETDFTNCISNLEGHLYQSLASKTYQLLYEIEYKKNNLSKAIEYLNLTNSIKDSVLGYEKTNYINQLLIDFESEKKDKQIRLLNKEKQVQNNQQVILILTIIIIVIFSIFIYFRYKKNKQILENKLYNFTNKLIYKNQLIDEMEVKLKDKFNSNQLVSDEFLKELDELKSMKILTEEDWHIFQENFDKIFPKLILKINHIFSGLSAAELRLFLLIKLSISTKETASILGISIESVKKARYRLKKKLQLDEHEQLDDFVSNFN